MTRNQFFGCFCACSSLVAALFASASFAFAQSGDAPVESPSAATTAKDDVNSLGVRQQRVQAMVAELKEKFRQLAKSNAIEKDQADRLIEALGAVAESRIEDRMQRVVALLNGVSYSTAAEQQKEIIDDLKKIVDILTEEKDEREEEEKRLQKWRDEIKKLIEAETKLRAESDIHRDKEAAQRSLEEQIKELEELIARQGKANDGAKAARKGGLPALERAADQQRDVRKDTEKLAEEVGGADSSPGQPSPDGDAKDSPAGAGKPGAGKPGAAPLSRAASSQKKAEDALAKGKGAAAGESQENALKDLQQALDELKKERDRIASLPPDAMEKLAQDQDRTADKTGDLDKEMEKAPPPSGSPEGSEGQPGEGEGMGEGQGKSQPGQQKVQQAQQQMRGASEDLRKKNPDDASGDQKKAIDKLQEALDEIQRRLAQLREEMRNERLAKLEAHFRHMLAIQEPATTSTVELEALRAQEAIPARTHRFKANELAKVETQLAEMAQQALIMIEEDGTSSVFPHVVAEMRDELNSTSQLMGSGNTGSYVQGMQREIEQTLKELIDALEKAQKQSPPSDSPPQTPPPGEPPLPPLLPPSAELKLLRSAQLRVNRRTKSFDDVRPEALDDVLRQELKRISKLQSNVAEMTLEMIERN